MTEITDGTGAGYRAKVDDENRLRVYAITEEESDHANSEGDAYNINSGAAGLNVSTANESGILYFKNTETRNFHVTAIVAIMGPSTSGTLAKIRIYRNPTGGTLITDTNTTGIISSNRNFSSTKTLSSLAYNAAATDETITGGGVHIASMAVPAARVFFAIDELLGNGDSIAISYEILANTACLCSAAIIGHLKEA